MLASLGTRCANARNSRLIFVCWKAGNAYYDDETPEDPLTDAVHAALENASPVNEVIVQSVQSPDAATSAVACIREEEASWLIAGCSDRSGSTGATYTTNPLLRQSPCHTMVVYIDSQRSQSWQKASVLATDCSHDPIALTFGSHLVDESGALSLSIIEDDAGENGVEVGRRVLSQIVRDSSVSQDVTVSQNVFAPDAVQAMMEESDSGDLLIVGANQQDLVAEAVSFTRRPTVAVVKRAPPIKSWVAEKLPDWIPRLSAADYADLVIGLRRGSKTRPDFVIMLGLSAGIASVGLLQDSPAVVIGSMLLAPLMTPMIGGGLAIAQANEKLAKVCFTSITVGFLLTLVISTVIGLLTPGEDLPQSVVARGYPNILDLVIALFSAVAASYALARPSLVGAVAGVAIATALVPPLCSVGIAIAYGYYLIGLGAATLFMINVVAIIVAAAATFRFMGVTSPRAGAKKGWVYQVTTVLAVIVLLLVIPLGNELTRQIEMGRPQPIAYPLPKSVVNALLEHVADRPEFDIMLAGRTSAIEDSVDVSIWISAERPLSKQEADEIVSVVHREMGDESLIVEVRSLVESWKTEHDNQVARSGDDKTP